MITVMHMLACRQVYNPPVSAQNTSLLVVDGTLIAGNDSTIIKLSRTRNLVDTLLSRPELQAQVMVIGEAAETFPLLDQGNGRYVTDQLNLNSNEKYQLRIILSGGKEYLSDKISVKQTPVIDSLSWRQDSVGVHVFVNTHDPQNNTWYYRWDYAETWQYRTAFETFFDIQNEQVVFRPPDQHIYNCWSFANSTNIEVASSVKLSQDIIYQNPVAFIPQGSEKISIKYSILMKQYAISSAAYEYWQNLKKNTEQLGTLFDAQPTQLVGNIHCTSSPDEPVLGFVDLSTIQSARIFINNTSLNYWNYIPYYNECGQKGFRDDDNPPANLDYYFPPTGRRDYVLLGTDMGTYLYTTLRCADCRDHGGINVKPAYWP